MTKWVLSVLVALLFGLVGCTSQEDEAPATPPPTPTAATTSAAPTTSTPVVTEHEKLSAYLTSGSRTARFQAAVDAFGIVVLQQMRMRGDSAWGVFDNYCKKPGQTSGGFTSEGWTVMVGDTCSVQHNPNYGFPKDMQISADLKIGGGDQNEYLGALITTPRCATTVYFGATSVDVSIGLPPNTQSPGDAKTLAEAQAIDEKAFNCLLSTRP